MKKLLIVAFIVSIIGNLYFLNKRFPTANPSQTDTGPEVIFIGNSLTAGLKPEEFSVNSITNLGVPGQRTDQLLHSLQSMDIQIARKVFIEIGINDIILCVDEDTVYNNIVQVIETLKSKNSLLKIHLHSIFPTCGFYKRSMPAIVRINHRLEAHSKAAGIKYIDMFNGMLDNTGALDKTVTTDGIHLNQKGYLIWKEKLEPYLQE